MAQEQLQLVLFLKPFPNNLIESSSISVQFFIKCFNTVAILANPPQAKQNLKLVEKSVISIQQVVLTADRLGAGTFQEIRRERVLALITCALYGSTGARMDACAPFLQGGRLDVWIKFIICTVLSFLRHRLRFNFDRERKLVREKKKKKKRREKKRFFVCLFIYFYCYGSYCLNTDTYTRKGDFLPLCYSIKNNQILKFTCAFVPQIYVRSKCELSRKIIISPLVFFFLT